MKWHFSQLSTKFVYSHLFKTLLIMETVVHQDLQNLLTETMKYCRHTPLKSSRCITQTKRHTPISISIVRTHESGILLIRGVNMNLGEARIPIMIAKVGVFR